MTTAFQLGLQELERIIPNITKQKNVRITRAGFYGVPSIDFITGGIPCGLTEIYGKPSRGKTTILYQAMANAQRRGMIVGLIPAEFLDSPYLEQQGVSLDAVPLFRMIDQDLTETTSEFISSDNTLLCIDSLTALTNTDNWLETAYDYLQTLLASLGRGSAVLFTNQVRMTRSLLSNNRFAESDSAARKIRELFSQRINLERENVSEQQFTLRVNVIANTLRRPCCTIPIPFKKGIGIDIRRDFLNTVVSMGLVERKGRTYRYAGVTLGTEIDSIFDYLYQHPTINCQLRSNFQAIIEEDHL